MYLLWWLIFVWWISPDDVHVSLVVTNLCWMNITWFEIKEESNSIVHYELIFILSSGGWLTLELIRKSILLVMIDTGNESFWQVPGADKSVKQIFLVINDNGLPETARTKAVGVDEEWIRSVLYLGKEPHRDVVALCAEFWLNHFSQSYLKIRWYGSMFRLVGFKSLQWSWHFIIQVVDCQFILFLVIINVYLKNTSCQDSRLKWSFHHVLLCPWRSYS